MLAPTDTTDPGQRVYDETEWEPEPGDSVGNVKPMEEGRRLSPLQRRALAMDMATQARTRWEHARQRELPEAVVESYRATLLSANSLIQHAEAAMARESEAAERLSQQAEHEARVNAQLHESRAERDEARRLVAVATGVEMADGENPLQRLERASLVQSALLGAVLLGLTILISVA